MSQLHYKYKPLLLFALVIILTMNSLCFITANAQTYAEEHIAYYESNKYTDDITGYFGVLSDIHEYTKNDSTMLKYSIVDDLKKLITLDWGNLTGREEYEVLLAEIMMNDASLSGLDDLYKRNLKNSILEVAKYIANEYSKLAQEVDSDRIQEATKRIKELIEKMEEIPYDSIEFGKTYDEYKDFVIKRTDLKRTKRFSSYLGTAITVGNSIYESNSAILTTIEYGEAYKYVSDEFVTVLTKFRDKLNNAEAVKAIKSKYNITDPFFVDAMTKATNDFIDKMEQYKESGSVEVASQALAEAGGKLAYDVGADKFSDFIRGIFPLINGTLVLSEAGQFVMDINPKTDFDRIAYSGNMFARLYYIEVYLKELMDDLGNDLNNNMNDESAYLFDEGISIYKSVESSAEKYAAVYVQKKIEENQNIVSEKENSWLPWDRSKLKKAQETLDQFNDFQKKLEEANKKTEAILCHNTASPADGNNDSNISNAVHAYVNTIHALISQYGPLRIVQNNGEWQNEANGLCYLNLIDFTGDGEDELFAVCKNEDQEHYSGFVYQLTNNQAEQIFTSDHIECNFDFDQETVYISHSKDTGYIIGSGWEGDDAEDRTYYWYNNGSFAPVFRLKGFWDMEQDKYVTEEKNIIVDLFGDDHYEEIWNNHESITLRSYDEYDADSNYFTSYKLRKSIDDVIRKFGIDPSELPASITVSETKMDELSKPVIYHCMEDDLDRWAPEVEDTESFWDVMCFYCSFTNWINNVEYPRLGEGGEYNIISNEILKNAAYAFYPDFDGNLPQIGEGIWRARKNDSSSTGIVIGDTAPFKIIDKNYKSNEDGSVDAEYVIEYWGDIPGGTYRVHFEPNAHYDESQGSIAYYYGVSSVEMTEKPSANGDKNSDDSSGPEDNTGLADSSGDDYQKVIDQYIFAYEDFELYREDNLAFMEKYPLVNADALIEPYLSSLDLSFYSALGDINGDGVDELFIGVGFERAASIYTHHDGQVIPLINDVGERSFINIYDDGTIYRHDSGGAAYSFDTVYQMNERGDGLDIIKQFEADWDKDPDYPYYDGTERLSPEQFNAEYVNKKEMELQWSMVYD